MTRTVVITGASDGIGAQAGRQLADSDTRVVIVGRSPDKTRTVADGIGADFYCADFARLDDVRELAESLRAAYDRIDVLANNAGGIFSGPTMTEDGFELTFQVNHLAPTLLTHLLLDRLTDSRASVVNTSSIGARLLGRLDLEDMDTRENFSSNLAYGNAKLANILFTRALHERFHSRGLSTVAFHPGVVATNFASTSGGSFQRIYHGALKAFLVSPERGGARLRHFIDGQPKETWRSGEYYGSTRRIGRPNRVAYDPETVQAHWDRSARMLGIRW